MMSIDFESGAMCERTMDGDGTGDGMDDDGRQSATECNPQRFTPGVTFTRALAEHSRNRPA